MILKPLGYNLTQMSAEEYAALKESIRLHGFSEHLPIKVWKQDGEGIIVDGHHRWKAALELGLKEEDIPLEFHEYSSKAEAYADAVLSNKDRGTLTYFELSRLWEDLYSPWEKGKHGEISQEEIGKAFGFKGATVSDIRPIYSHLREIGTGTNFFNKELVNLARVEDDQLRKALVEHAAEDRKSFNSNRIQKLATLCNNLSSTVEKLSNEDAELEKEMLSWLLEVRKEHEKPRFLEDGEGSLKDGLGLLVEEHVSKRIINGDAFEELNKLKEESIDLIITDPPYNISSPEKTTKSKGKIQSLEIEWDKQGREEYLNFIDTLLQGISRVLRPGGSFYIFLDKAISSIVWWKCRDFGLLPKNIVHWHKSNPVPSPRKNNYLSAVEHIFYGIKQNGKFTFNFKSDNEMHNLIEFPEAGGEEREKYSHPTAKPVELIMKLIEISSNVGNFVLDPFAGRGTTAIAAMRLRRSWIVIEKDPEYYEVIKRWVKEEKKLSKVVLKEG